MGKGLKIGPCRYYNKISLYEWNVLIFFSFSLILSFLIYGTHYFHSDHRYGYNDKLGENQVPNVVLYSC